jgi:hypothetical protein
MSNIDTPKEKKGMSCLAIGGIGCLVIIVAIFLGGGAVVAKYWDQIKEKVTEFQKDPERAAFMLIFKANPNLEVVNDDQVKRELTFKVKGEAETYTLNLNDLKNSKDGKIKVKTSSGQEIELDPKVLGTGGSPSAPAPTPPALPAPAPAPNN